MPIGTIGPYQLLEEIGRGAVGVVFRGFDPAIGRQVAIKIIQSGQYANDEERSDLKQRFAREASAAGKLSHPNIVTVFQLAEEGGAQYLVLELVSGPSLEKALAAGQPLDSRLAISILGQVADALDYAHGEGVVHRDVKPANILVRSDGRAKITDFGIARIASQSVTRTGFTFGTPAYMAPEQIESAKVTGLADQYSLAVIAYQMLSGKRPFVADTGPSLMYQILQAKPPSLHLVNPALPPQASEVIAKAMAKTPEDRYLSCSEFIGRLSESLNPSAASLSRAYSVPVEWRPGSASRPGPRSSSPTVPDRRAFRAGLWIAAGLATLSLAGAVLVWRSRLAIPAGPQAPPGAGRKVNAKDGLTYIWIPPGTFRMGCSPEDAECTAGERPQHQVTISKGFWIGKTEVTQEAWQRVMHANPSDFKGPQLPVENVNWSEARGFCETVDMRLPTEAEWEYAARALTPGSRYGEIDAIAWFKGNSEGRTHEVAGKQANAYGIDDMLGNVFEWVTDWYDRYPAGKATDPKGPPIGEFRTLRGGSWTRDPSYARVSYRHRVEPDGRYGDVGVRCAGN
ncbi:MAG TPA: bifunctional serine/threonine-protein kinase/formylglycine-generating enzyme family protein [Bryobacteraceae bacterium]|nr:bifunctional serine/threonine-protein kinase/formylglycine-generating enzyme family protein [Bryobacteraceae bacterium]